MGGTASSEAPASRLASTASASPQKKESETAAATTAMAKPPVGKTVNASGKRICCACKETRAARDECIVLNGEEKCRYFVEAHNQCLRNEGFDVS